MDRLPLRAIVERGEIILSVISGVCVGKLREYGLKIHSREPDVLKTSIISAIPIVKY